MRCWFTLSVDQHRFTTDPFASAGEPGVLRRFSAAAPRSAVFAGLKQSGTVPLTHWLGVSGMEADEANRLRLRHQLLEFLKFRVLAAEDQFFSDASPEQRRAWLKSLFPRALSLSDQDLEQVWAQAYALYGCH